MGRLLVRVFLGSILLAAVGFLLAMYEAVLFVVRIVVDGPNAASLTLVFPKWDTGLVLILSLYFFLALPILVALFFLREGLALRHRPEPALRPNGHNGTAPNEKTVVLLTAYNDEASIGLAVREFRQVDQVQEVVVIDNNSSDHTAEVAQAAGATVIGESRQGYGFACMGGLRYALDHTDAERIVLSEGDMTFFSEDVKKLLPYLDDCDLVLGTRTTRTLTRKGSQMDWFLAWGNMFLAHLIRMRYWDPVFMGQARLTDVGCTFRTIRRAPLRRILDKLTVGGHYFSPHMILVALREGLSVVEVPIKFRERVGKSKGAGGGRRRAMLIGFQMIAEITLH